MFSAILHSPKTPREEKALAQCLCENFLARETGMRGQWNQKDLEKFWEDMKTTPKTFQLEVWEQVGVFETKENDGENHWVVPPDIKAMRQKFLILEGLSSNEHSPSSPVKKM